MAEGFFWDLPESGRRIPFAVLRGCETCPIQAHSQSKIWRVRWLGDDRNVFSGRGIAAQQAMCVARSVIAMQEPQALPFVPLAVNCIAEPLLKCHAELTSSTRSTLSGRYEPVVQQTVDAK
jgi:hypothetical protein